MQFLNVSSNKDVLAFFREKDDDKIIVIINLSNTDSKISINEKSLIGDYRDIFEDEKISVDKDFEIVLEGYQYFVIAN